MRPFCDCANASQLNRHTTTTREISLLTITPPHSQKSLGIDGRVDATNFTRLPTFHPPQCVLQTGPVIMRSLTAYSKNSDLHSRRCGSGCDQGSRESLASLLDCYVKSHNAICRSAELEKFVAACGEGILLPCA